MFDHLVAKGGLTLYKRSAEGYGDGAYAQLPGWAWGVNLLIFIPALFYVYYTLESILPTLAIVEDPDLPSYQPVSLNADTDSVAEDSPPAPPYAADPDPAATPPVSASLRALHRLLYAVGGWRAAFRGLWCAAAYGLVSAFVAGLAGALPFVPRLLAPLVSGLAAAQLSAAWVHVVVTPPSPLPFYRRLPSPRRTLRATTAPVALYWAASLLAAEAPRLVAALLRLDNWDPTAPHQIPAYSALDSWKVLVVGLVSVALSMAVVVPALVLLVRVQASLLPPDADTIVPFDRSFGGAVEPAVVSGKGYVGVRDALRTVSRASWIRIYVLQVKVTAVSLGVYVALFTTLICEMALVGKWGPE